jgi:hypothetical protein
MCPTPTSLFTGRDHKIEQVETCIICHDSERCVVVLHGLGGAGKTQIALKAIEKTQDQWMVIVYIDSTSRNTIMSILKGFAKTKKIGDTHEDAINWLGGHTEQWIMLFDGVDDPSLGVSDFFPPGNRGSIIITTRLPQLSMLAQGRNPVCDVSSMDRGEALQLLLNAARLQEQPLSDMEKESALGLLQV